MSQMSTSGIDLIQGVLESTFGYKEFRDDQREVIQCALDKQDTLVIMPTGGGKSLCYQIPALVQNGLTLVISPLIALMADQVQALKTNGIEAEFVNSTMDSTAKRAVFEKMEAGQLQLLYISPEKALSPAFLNYISQKEINLIAIDEAHCVSIWGNDFRPEYARLSKLISKLPDVPIMALTATADKATQTDISTQLGLRQPRKFISSFERKNIYVQVLPGQSRLKQIYDFLSSQYGRAGIIYCLSRKSTEDLATKLRSAGYQAAHYHAEIPREEKKRVQHAFQNDEIQIICATIAFGMGIDKSNIRWIIHYNMPKNIESYYQEIGRAGRDGARADALLFFSYRDVSIFRRFIDESDAIATFQTVQHAKLDRIWEFTQASNCRTNLVLNYFGEYRQEGCGHCDNCLDPPQSFDGTELAKKALMVCHDAGEKLGLHLLIDVLRASGRKEIFYENLHQLKTYGIGRDLPRMDWQNIIIQLINQGLLEIDYTQKSTLKLTSLSQSVLHGEGLVHLTRRNQPQSKNYAVKVSAKERFRKAYLQTLTQLRKQIAEREGVPPYMLLSDKVLEEIFENKPVTVDDLLEIPGFGEHKWRKYGRILIENIQSFILSQEILKSVKGKSPLQSLQLWREGHTPEEIAEQRNIQPQTVYTHLAKMYEGGEAVDLAQYLTTSEIEEIKIAWEKAEYSDQLTQISQYLPHEQPLFKIRLALALFSKEKA